MQSGVGLCSSWALSTMRVYVQLNARPGEQVDDAVSAITVSGYTEGMLLPRAERFPACKHYAFINGPEGLPEYVQQYCRPPAKEKGVLVCGEACWKAPSLQEWLEIHRSGMTWFGLVLRLCEEHQDEDLSFHLQGVLAAGSRVPLSLLGLWCGVRAPLYSPCCTQQEVPATLKCAS